MKKNKGKYIVEIVAEFETQEACDAKEIEFIALYGRSNLKGGTLCNLTDGGDGSTNIVHSEETKAKLRAAVADGKHPNFGKKLSAETCRKKSEALKGEKHHLFGTSLPQEWRDKIAAGKIGEKNPWFGKPSPASKQVKNIKTGVIYDSIARAAKAEGIKPGKLYSILDGHTKVNTTDLVRI
ncbi:NUMOD3 domain-containing DNA-binding protein [Geitlerinema calcuttense]|uniref:NUMOD3 domain-containing DNA-binding protein n=1 Tax=Geitlerinema calcuttense NRMC-F 0142 TaxID=2922238 RepID=A0ABT7LVZ1_9CYAN|nr:NUMOD3 domain-containing DNA-binding protein [Geitlerinema calcuttense]MDL5055904.1 NUMOD3 domain-containing DNA-binding protein [Geitlerinema calcuttense NRMC-F 0142]